jgi:transposase
MEQPTIAIDLAKSVFQVAVSRRPGHVDEERRLTRSRMHTFFAQTPRATVLMEACGSSHYWARERQAFGHTVRLLPAQDVHRYVRRNKTDRTDAKALLEAIRNDDIHPVPVKTVEQQALASLHRLRSTWIATRIGRLNTVRGLLREFGVVIPVGAHRVVPHVQALVDDAAAAIPAMLRVALADCCDDIRTAEQHVRDIERQLAAVAKQMRDVALLQTVPGIGLITATAFVAMIGDIHRFPSGRHFASFLGLTPKEASSAERRHLGAISKHGDVYLRTLLIHGARSLLWSAKGHRQRNAFETWALRVSEIKGHNIAAIAVANKLARIAWAVWKRQCPFRIGDGAVE